MGDSPPHPGPLPRGGGEGARRKARAALLVGVAGYLLVQAGLVLAVRTGAEPADDPAFAEKFALLRERPAFFAAESATVRVVALGSSRTHAAVDAGRLARGVGPGVEAFNFATPAGGPLTNALYLRRLLAAGVRADRVLIEVHPGYLSPLDPPFEARWLRPARLRPGEAGRLRACGWPVADPPHLGARGALTAVSVYRTGLTGRHAPLFSPAPGGLPLNQPNDAFGYAPGPPARPAWRPKGLKATRAQYSDVLEQYAVAGPGCAAVRDLLAVCRAHHLPAALLVSAEDATVRGWYGDAGNAAIRDFVRGTAREFAVPVFDGREWLEDADTVDGHHCTPGGAERFTDRLIQEAAAWVRGQP